MKNKELQTYLVLKEIVWRRGVDEKLRRWISFYTTPVLPQPHSHCVKTVIFQQTHLQSEISHLMPQVVFCFPSPLPVHFLVSDVPIMLCRFLSSSRMSDPMISQDGSCHHHQKMHPQVQEVEHATWKSGNVPFKSYYRKILLSP